MTHAKLEQLLHKEDGQIHVAASIFKEEWTQEVFVQYNDHS